MSDENHPVTIEDLNALEERLRGHMEERERRLEERLKTYIDERSDRLETKLLAFINEREERLRSHIEERIEHTETKLLTAFHGWASAMEIRVRTGDAHARGMDERLSLLEERVSRLERGQK